MGSCSDINILPNLEPLRGKQVGLNYTRFKGKRTVPEWGKDASFVSKCRDFPKPRV